MQQFVAELFEQITGTYIVLFLAYFSLLVSWPLFLWLEKRYRVHQPTPRSNYVFNWQVTASNLLLAPFFLALAVLSMSYLARATGLPSLSMSTSAISVGIPLLDLVLQATLIFFTSVFIGDFSYYWWHRLQHKNAFLWEIHKLHHSEEDLNSTTIYRSHFLEPAGQAIVKGLTIGLIFDTSEVPQTTLAVVAGILLPALWDYFIHANVRIDALNRWMPFFSVPQYHWIHHSNMPEHRDRNFAIWLPMFDVAFGSYYGPKVDEYPATGLASGEKMESVWGAQREPFVAWSRMLKSCSLRRLSERPS